MSDFFVLDSFFNMIGKYVGENEINASGNEPSVTLTSMDVDTGN